MIITTELYHACVMPVLIFTIICGLIVLADDYRTVGGGVLGVMLSSIFIGVLSTGNIEAFKALVPVIAPVLLGVWLVTWLVLAKPFDRRGREKTRKIAAARAAIAARGGYTNPAKNKNESA
jgi:hypothetical protein